MSRAAVAAFVLLISTACGGTTDVVRGDAAAGAEVYRANCAGCHGPGGEGAAQGPPLIDEMYAEDVFPDEALVDAVRNGARSDAWDFPLMPAMPGLSSTDLSDVLAHVRGLQAAASGGT